METWVTDNMERFESVLLSPPIWVRSGSLGLARPASNPAWVWSEISLLSRTIRQERTPSPFSEFLKVVFLMQIFCQREMGRRAAVRSAVLQWVAMAPGMLGTKLVEQGTARAFRHLTLINGTWPPADGVVSWASREHLWPSAGATADTSLHRSAPRLPYLWSGNA